MMYNFWTVALVALPSIHAFTQTPFQGNARPLSVTSLSAKNDAANFFVGAALMSAIAIGGPAFADEYGKETEAPTLFTGETVMVSYQ